MDAVELYQDYKKELQFGMKNSGRKDYIRGGILGLTALLLLGLPTYFGYLLFILRAQSNNTDILPPIRPNMIGEYTYIGAKYLSVVVVYGYLIGGITWLLLSIQTHQTIQYALVLSFLFVSGYLLPAITYLFATTNIPIPTTKQQSRNFVSAVLSYEYMTFVLFSILGFVTVIPVLFMSFLFVFTIPILFISVWYIGICYIRMVGYSFESSDI